MLMSLLHTHTCTLSRYTDVKGGKQPTLSGRLNRAGQPGSIALPLAHCTFLTQLEFHSYLWRRGTVRGNNLWLHTSLHTHTFSACFHFNSPDETLYDNILLVELILPESLTVNFIIRGHDLL